MASPEVRISLPLLWPSLWAQLPAPLFGSGPHTQYFGLLFGDTTKEEAQAGVLDLTGAALCHEPFVWEPFEQHKKSLGCNLPGSSMEVIQHLEAELVRALALFLSSTFNPWAASQEAQAEGSSSLLAWLVLNDGEGYALSAPLVDFGRGVSPQSTCPSGCWRSTAVVVDRAKSSMDAADLEVFSLAGAEPRRLVFDLSA